MQIVCNASPVIFLAKIDLLHILPALSHKLIIPDGVYKEILPGKDDARDWLINYKKDFVANVSSIPTIITAWDLGIGESQVLSYAYSTNGFIAALDDKAARNCAKSLQIDVIGTLGLILMAKKKLIIPDAVMYLNKLAETDFRINDELFAKAIDLANRV